MGQLAQATQGQTLAAARPAQDFKSLLKSQWNKIAEVLPQNMSSERFFQLAVSAYNSEPKLAQCSTISVLSCVMKCAALGLEPSAVDGLGRGAEGLGAVAAESLRQFKALAAAFAGSRCVGCS